MNKLIEQVLKRFDEKFKWFPMMSPNNEVKGKPMVKQFLKEELTNIIKMEKEEELPNAIDEDGNPVRIWLS